MSTASAPPRSVWILGPFGDLAYIVATPLAIVPVVWWLHERVFLPEQISLFVMAFASLGHHLPGFMRAYGDRELFARFRWRFLLTPPLLLATCLAFTAPAVLNVPLADLWSQPALLASQPQWHALELIAFFWATWHGLMQTYGFMRIYDVKRGVARAASARLDLALCIAMFTAGVVLSDSRAYQLMDAAWQCGLPLVDVQWLTAARWIVAAATAAIVLVYVFDLVVHRHVTGGINWVKALLALSTGGLYWFSGLVTTNIIVGVAMFEIFHAVQYYAVVWVYNRTLHRRIGERFGPLGFLFRDRWGTLGLYLATIAAFGSVRWFTDDIQNDAVQRLLAAAFLTSTLLHYYYDGFIWKVRERKTQVNLDAAPSTARVEQQDVPGWIHAGKWAALYAVLAGVTWLERHPAPWSSTQEANEDDRVRQLAAWFPDVPEAQLRLSEVLLQEGDAAGALIAARRGLENRERSHAAHAQLGAVLLESGAYRDAALAMSEAIRIAPWKWEYYSKHAAAMLESGAVQQALLQYDKGLQIAPHSTLLASGRIQALLRAGRGDEALSAAEDFVARYPASSQIQLAHGMALAAQGRAAEAAAALKTAVRLDDSIAEAHYHLAHALVKSGDVEQALAEFHRAVECKPNLPLAWFELGQLYLARNRGEHAIQAFRRAVQCNSTFVEAHANLGAALHAAGRLDEAAASYRRAIDCNPRHAQSHFNLGHLLLQQGDQTGAREHLRQAQQLGMEPTPEVKAALGL